MCGITGFISSSETESIAGRRRLSKMCDAIRHRGPDEEGLYVEGRAALGMRRLSIIDLKSGQQPIYSEDGNLVIVFNGEIYNFREIKSELEKRGHRFRTNSDTEVIVHAFEEFGADCLEKLRGMFAFAIWNVIENRLFIARDRTGKKPLFYGRAKDGSFVFGSEIKTLLSYGQFDKEIDLRALDAYLSFGYVPEEFCIFKGINKLEPGHFLSYESGQLAVTRYWDFEYEEPIEVRSDASYIEELQELLEESVRIRLISDVPLGALLSGGVDSSTVVSMMAKISNLPVKTFSIGFRDEDFDELKFARLAARTFATEHHEFLVTPDLISSLDQISWHFDEPFGDSSALPTFMVSRMAREFVTVVLSGDGGDELFAGYSRYLVDKGRNRWGEIPRPIRSGMRIASNMLPHRARGKNFVYNVSLDAQNRYIDSVSIFNLQRRRALYSPDFVNRLNGQFGAGEKSFAESWSKPGNGDPLTNLLYLDSKTYLPGDVLVKVDRMTMANSLEARAPFLDHKLVEFAGRLPGRLKMKGKETKHILKQAMKGVVPDSILFREKQGFGVPIRNWINNELQERVQSDLSDLRATQRGYFEKSYVARLLDEHKRERRDNSHLIWTLWMFELWHRRYLDENPG